MRRNCLLWLLFTTAFTAISATTNTQLKGYGINQNGEVVIETEEGQPIEISQNRSDYYSPQKLSDASSDMENAMNVMNAINNIGSNLKAGADILGVADKIMPALTAFAAVDPVIAVVGVVFSLVEMFLPSQQSIMEKQLQAISKQISYLQADMDEEFQKVLEAIKYDTCLSRYTDAENILLTASKKLQLYYQYRGTEDEDLYRQFFMQECGNAKCDDATSLLLSAINGDPGLAGCDLVKVLYESNPAQSYVQGWRDQVVSKSAYLLSLVNKGVIIVSTYYCIQRNDTDAWREVQNLYQDSIKGAINHIQSYDSKCLQGYLINGQGVVERYISDNQGQSHHDMGKNLIDNLIYYYPFILWQVTVYAPISGWQNHALFCYDCFIKLRFCNYNLVVAAVDPWYDPNYDALENPNLQKAASVYYSQAIDVNKYITKQDCFYGVEVVKRYVDLWTWSNFGDRQNFIVGETFTLVVWALEDSPCLDWGSNIIAKQ